jgi:hypothetical protein
MTAINLDLLKAYNKYLFSVVVNATGHMSGSPDVDISTLPVSPEQQMKLAEFSMIPRTQPEPQINMAELQEEQRAAIQMAADEAAAKNRLNEYAAAGLEESDFNFNLIKDFVTKTANGYWTSQIVDESIQRLGPKGTNVLTWTPKTATVEPPAAPVVEVLADWQLPLDCDERAMKAAGVPALQDLIKRRRAASNQTYLRRGGFGSKFI